MAAGCREIRAGFWRQSSLRGSAMRTALHGRPHRFRLRPCGADAGSCIPRAQAPWFTLAGSCARKSQVQISGIIRFFLFLFITQVHYTSFSPRLQAFGYNQTFICYSRKLSLNRKKPAEAGRQKRAEAEKVQNSPGFFLLFFKLNRSPAGQKRIELQHCSEHAIIIKAECIRILSQPDIERD